MFPVFCLMGPTASGKTDLAMSLADHFPIEIISVDSTQIYQGMDIGAGKPSETVLQRYPHHLMSFLDPSCAYSAAKFCQDANQCIREIRHRQRIPLLVGGTMMYFKALQTGLSSLPEADLEIRAQLNQRLQAEGIAALYQQLQRVDPITAQRLQPGDTQRIQRALEVWQMSGKALSAWLQLSKATPNTEFTFINIALLPLITSRQVLHKRIETRFDNMLAQGLVAEVQSLFQRSDLNLSLPALRAVGYRQVWRYLSKEIDYDEMRNTSIAATRQLAKRQLTWLRSWPGLVNVDFENSQLALDEVKHLFEKHAL